MNLPKITPIKINKVKVAAITVTLIATMYVGYVAISAGVKYTNQQLDQFAIARVKSNDLIPETKTVVTKVVPVVTTEDIQGQINSAISSNLGK